MRGPDIRDQIIHELVRAICILSRGATIGSYAKRVEAAANSYNDTLTNEGVLSCLRSSNDNYDTGDYL